MLKYRAERTIMKKTNKNICNSTKLLVLLLSHHSVCISEVTVYLHGVTITLISTFQHIILPSTKTFIDFFLKNNIFFLDNNQKHINIVMHRLAENFVTPDIYPHPHKDFLLNFKHLSESST